MSKISLQFFQTSIGELMIGSFKDQLCLCDWRYRKMRSAIDNRIQKGLDASYTEEATPVIRAAQQQIAEYIAGDREEFDLAIRMIGTTFQQSIWEELLNIPYGKTETYYGLSRNINNEKAIRAVAAANGANAISIIIPCHRIIGSNGDLIGYAGGINVKKKLLLLEARGNNPEQLQLFD